jgi:hypothetical protein
MDLKRKLNPINVLLIIGILSIVVWAVGISSNWDWKTQSTASVVPLLITGLLCIVALVYLFYKIVRQDFGSGWKIFKPLIATWISGLIILIFIKPIFTYNWSLSTAVGNASVALFILGFIPMLFVSPFYILLQLTRYTLVKREETHTIRPFWGSFIGDWKRVIVLMLILFLFAYAVSVQFIQPEKCNPPPANCKSLECLTQTTACCSDTYHNVASNLSCLAATVKLRVPIWALISFILAPCFYFLSKTFSENEAFLFFRRKVSFARFFGTLALLFLIFGVVLLLIAASVLKLLEVFAMSSGGPL